MFFVLLDDFLYYGMHRYMHENKWLLRNIHSVWNPVHLLPVYEGPVYHDFHHAKFKGNYAGFLPYLDKYLGKTHIPAYLRYLKAKKRGLTAAEIAKQEGTG